jgi:hypothetical protein
LFFCPLFLAKKLDLPDRVIHRGLTVWSLRHLFSPSGAAACRQIENTSCVDRGTSATSFTDRYVRVFNSFPCNLSATINMA